MGRRHSGHKLTIGLFLALVMLVGGPAASAFAVAKVRLVNARAGSHPIGLKITVGSAVAPAVGPASYGQVTPYVSVSPGTYPVAGAKPGSSTPIFQKQVALSAGVATTAILTGSGGAPERLITATDDTLTPAGAPETGLGGLAGGGGPPWALIALAAGLAGAIGGGWRLS